jgi:DNA-binding response OmpR family regulator
MPSIIERKAFDLVPLDLALPDAHGLNTLARVREAAPDLPIVIMTVLTTSRWRRRCAWVPRLSR